MNFSVLQLISASENVPGWYHLISSHPITTDKGETISYHQNVITAIDKTISKFSDSDVYYNVPFNSVFQFYVNTMWGLSCLDGHYELTLIDNTFTITMSLK